MANTWMEEILHQLVDGLPIMIPSLSIYNYLQRLIGTQYFPSGTGFLPPTRYVQRTSPADLMQLLSQASTLRRHRLLLRPRGRRGYGRHHQGSDERNHAMEAKICRATTGCQMSWQSQKLVHVSLNYQIKSTKLFGDSGKIASTS